MRHEVVHDEAGLRALGPKWSDLLARSGRNALPLTHLWAFAWWKNFGGNGQPRVHCFYEGSDLVAIAPMLIEQVGHRRVSIRQLVSMANGHSPFWDILTTPQVDVVRLNDIVLSISASDEVDWTAFIAVPDDSPLYRLFQRRIELDGHRVGMRNGLTTPLIRIDCDWPTFFSARSRKFRKNMTNKVNRFARAEGCHIERRVLTSPEDPAIEAMIQVSACSWKAGAGTDLRSKPKSLGFFRDLIGALGPAGGTQVWIAWQREKPIAYEFHAIYGGVTYPLRADFDESARELSPGSVIEYGALKDLFEEGTLTLYDSCANDYWYLSNWTAERRVHHDILVFGSGLRSRCLYEAEYRLIPALRKFKNKFRRSSATDLAPQSSD